MSMVAKSGNLGRARARREPIEVIEPKPQDTSLDNLIGVRRQRLNRLERERREAHEAWRGQRAALSKAKHSWRNAVAAAQDFWRQERAGFLRMTITSGQFRKAKAAYERMKNEAAKLHTQAKEQVHGARGAGHAFFEARQRVMEINRQVEKLGMLRDEIRAAARQQEG